jgi:hypothetical protein
MVGVQNIIFHGNLSFKIDVFLHTTPISNKNKSWIKKI